MITEKESILIQPFVNPCRAVIKVPGSKSISNRALILSVMCKCEVELNGLLQSEDVDLMQQALLHLGVNIQKNGNKIIVFGNGGVINKKECTINVGNAGTIARFLTCLLAAQIGGVYHMDGTPAMRERPMLELLNCLESLGCKIEYQKNVGHFPFTLYTNSLNNNKIEIDARKSGQNISGLLMQCPVLNNDCTVSFTGGTVSMPFIDMTLKMMRSFIHENTLNYSLSGKFAEVPVSEYKKNDFIYQIEPDATAASYFLTLPHVVGGNCKVLGMKEEMLQGDIGYCKFLNELGACIDFDDNGVNSSHLTTLTGGSFDFVDISDTFLSLAAISPLLNNKLEIYGIEHTRKQETDRVSAMAQELSKLGQDVTEKPDRLIIQPDLNKLRSVAAKGIEIDTYKDHRFAMSFAILGSFDLFGDGRAWMKIKDPGCCAKTFPGFFECLNTALEDSHEEN